MAKTREKKVLINNITREKAEDAFAEYAQADALQQKIQAQMDISITKIRDKNASQLAELADKKTEAFEKMQAYATENIEDFGKKKSMEMAHGIIGFRIGTPSLKLKSKSYTLASALTLLKEFGQKYVRTKEEMDKASLIADREDDDTKALIDKVGLMIVQDETFYVEAKKELAE